MDAAQEENGFSSPVSAGSIPKAWFENYGTCGGLGVPVLIRVSMPPEDTSLSTKSHFYTHESSKQRGKEDTQNTGGLNLMFKDTLKKAGAFLPYHI